MTPYATNFLKTNHIPPHQHFLLKQFKFGTGNFRAALV